MARRKRPALTNNHERWLISYADFLTLLFAFFVVMYSTSVVNVGSFRVLSDTIVRALDLPGVSFDPSKPDGEGTLSASLGIPDAVNAPAVPLRAAGNSEQDSSAATTQSGDINAAEEVQRVRNVLQSALGDLVSPDSLSLSANDKWVEIKIPAQMLFPSGSRSLLASSIPILTRIAETLQAIPNEVVVQGHTDNQPIRNGQFPSNWELSTARAAAVARVMQDAGLDPSRLSAVGFADNRPIVDNATEEGRAENRRVVILVRSAVLSEVLENG